MSCCGSECTSSELFVLVVAGGGMGMALQASPPPAALAALPVIANQYAMGILLAGGINKEVAQRALGSLPVGGNIKGVAQRTLNTPPSYAVVETAVTAMVALVARSGTAVCTGSCTGGNLQQWLSDVLSGHHHHGNGPSRCQPLHEFRQRYGG
jgi:hypothetical protein